MRTELTDHLQSMAGHLNFVGRTIEKAFVDCDDVLEMRKALRPALESIRQAEQKLRDQISQRATNA